MKIKKMTIKELASQSPEYINQWINHYYTQGEIETAKEVLDLSERKTNPEGSFDKAGRFYPEVMTESIACIREPSRAYPYSYMSHCRGVEYNSELNGVDPKNVRKVLNILKKI